MTANYASNTANYAYLTANYASLTANYANSVLYTVNNTVTYLAYTANVANATATAALAASISANSNAQIANNIVQQINQAVSVQQGYLPNLSLVSSTVPLLNVQSNLNVTGNLSILGTLNLSTTPIFGCGVCLYTLGGDVTADHIDGPNGDYIIKWGSLQKFSVVTTPSSLSVQFIRTGVFNCEISAQPIDSLGRPDSIGNVYLYTNTTNSLAGATLVYRDSPSTQINPYKALIKIPINVSNRSTYYILGLSFTRSSYPYTLKQTALPSGSTGGTYFQFSYMGGATDQLPILTDTTMINSIGTNSPSAVVIGNQYQPLTLQCSQLTIPVNLGISAATTTSLGTSAAQAVVVGNPSQSTYIQGNPVNLPSTTDLSLVQNFGTSSSGSVTIGAPGRPLVLQGNPVFPASSDFSAVNSLGSAAAASVSIGTSNQQLSLVGTRVNLPTTTDASQVNNLGTNLGGSLTIGTVNQSINFNGNPVMPSTANLSNVSAFGSSSSSSVFLGNPSQQLSLQGNPVNLPSTSNLSQVTSIGSSASSLTLGSSGVPITFQGITNPLGFGGSLSDEISTLTPTATFSFRSPFPFNIRSSALPMFSLNVLPTATTPVTFDILKNNQSIYSVKPTIPSTSTTYCTGGNTTGTLLVNPTVVNLTDLISAQVVNAGSGAPAGAKVYIYAS